MSSRTPMTRAGYEQLKAELKHKKTVERPETSNAIEVARAHGDLSENAEYHAAKEKLGFIEGRIQEIEGKLAMAEIIDPAKLGGSKVVFGATVTLMDVENDSEVTYQIVGVDEADLKERKISVSAPMARALIGREEGDEVSVRSPKGGSREYEIVSVAFV